MSYFKYGGKVFRALEGYILRPTEAVGCLNDYDAKAARHYINIQAVLLKGDKRLKTALNKRATSKDKGQEYGG